MKLLKSLLAAVITTVMVCSLSISTFAYTDVHTANRYQEQIQYVDQLGLLTSSQNGEFRPDEFLTRADAIKAAYRMINGGDNYLEEYEKNALPFVIGAQSGDIDDVSHLIGYLNWALDFGIITQNVEELKFYPNEPITAAEFSAVLAKVLGLTKGDETMEDYGGLVTNILGDISESDETVRRDMAAAALTNAMHYDQTGKVVGELGVYRNYDGEKINCLAVNNFGMNTVDLQILATYNRPLEYDVEYGVLFSNGVTVTEIKDDLSSYVGYGVRVTFVDNDNSNVYTEGEKFIAYSLYATTAFEVNVDQFSVASATQMSTSYASSPFSIFTSTVMYLNDSPWPTNEPDKYDLVQLVQESGSSALNIANRPNLMFTCIQYSSVGAIDVVFATENSPGKILGVNNGVYAIKDYYSLGTDNEIRTFTSENVKLYTGANVGDFVNFHISAGKIYIYPGSAKQAAYVGTETDANTGNIIYNLSDESQLYRHQLYKAGSFPLVENQNMIFLVDDTKQEYLISWDRYETNQKLMQITEVTLEDIADGDNTYKQYTVTGTWLSSGSTGTFTVLGDNVSSPTAIAVGDYITYSDNGESGDELVTYMSKASEIDVNATFIDDSFRANNGKTYYINSYYQGNILNPDSEFTTGDVTLVIDDAESVIAIKY